MKLLLVIDSGTTNSRIRLTDGTNVLATVSRPVGAKDVAVTGSTQVLEAALREAIEELLTAQQLTMDEIESIIASGMITSNMGLLEIPHLPAPAGIDEMKAGMISRTYPSVTDRPILFVPGIKTGFQADANLMEKDMMRGEEAEIIGYLHEIGEAAQEPMLFMHYGSHHKGILLENGRIVGCATSVTGELMMAIQQQTILKNSLVSPSDVLPDLAIVKQGLAIARASGFGHALFRSRIMHVMDGEDKQAATSLFLGALIALDMAMLEQMMTAETKHIVLYGKELFPSLFRILLNEQYPHMRVTVISEALSDQLSAKGAVQLYQAYKEGLN
ncbi:2-dehydro-3-deoxygalactonokinase [Paenibacillus mendelii]|uniref:2-dehydro-3-deoxygalactonokinase n=1 Tax=Paenibacillus mendelii TaxID=206163 RepID=A0ABV6JEL7_9BACL|nr:2-dehydro-3-deoxygalactonokinase [Paenibacillus mendelii]MCQ6563373.1 2-dehydro-3-deoxygalactonokinase [Paenibacillus mendelii]